MDTLKAQRRTDPQKDQPIPEACPGSAKQRLSELNGAVGNFPIADLLLRNASRADQGKLLDGFSVSLPISSAIDPKDWYALVSMCRVHHEGTIGMWQCLHGGSRNQAKLELAKKFKLIPEYEYEGLLNQLGLENRYRWLVERPWFNEVLGELWLGDELVGHVDPARSLNPRHVLRSFQKENWPQAIDGVCAGEWSHQQRLDTVRSLNKHLSVIRFHSHGSIISWRPISCASPTFH